MPALKGKAEGAVKPGKMSLLIVKRYSFLRVCLWYVEAFDIALKQKCGSEPRGPAEARCARMAIRSSRNSLHCSASPCAGTQVFCTKWAQPLHLSPKRRTDARGSLALAFL